MHRCPSPVALRLGRQAGSGGQSSPLEPERERILWVLASAPGAIYADAGQGPPSIACRLHFLDPVTLDAGLRMMLVDRLEARGVQHAIDHVVLLTEQDVVVRDPELVLSLLL